MTQARVGQMGLKTLKNGKFQNWPPTLGEGQTDLLGPVLTCFQTFWPILAQFLPGLETVMDSDMGQKLVQNDFFQKWPHTLWEG